MPKNGIQDLRNHLFETLEALKNKDDKDELMDIDRAKAICEVAGKIIDSAKVEVQFMQVNAEAQASNFFSGPQHAAGPQLTAGKTNGKAAA